MKTLQEIKDQYAISKGENCWDDFKENYHPTEVLNSMDEVAKIYANNRLEESANNLDWGNCYDGGCHCGRDAHEQSILSLKDEIMKTKNTHGCFNHIDKEDEKPLFKSIVISGIIVLCLLFTLYKAGQHIKELNDQDKRTEDINELHSELK